MVVLFVARVKLGVQIPRRVYQATKEARWGGPSLREPSNGGSDGELNVLAEEGAMTDAG